MKTLFFYLLIICCNKLSAQGRIGINTNSPQAMLHIKDSSVLFSGATLPITPGNPPASGAGIRMMWYPQKAAFRAGDPAGVFWNKDSIGNYSFAAGFSTKAKGRSSIAMGEDLEAVGDYSVAIGFNCNATHDYSIALGRQVTSMNTGSVAMGYGTQANGLASFAANYFNTCQGSYSTAFGFSTESGGQMSLATGYDTQADGIVSFAGGYRCVSPGSYSFATGFQSKSVPFASFVIGRYNVDSIGTEESWVNSDPLFMIGNGTDATNKSNAFTVLKNGKTAINGSNPAAALSIKGIDGSENSHLQLIDNNSSESAAIFYTGNLFFKNTSPTGDYYFRNSTNNNLLVLSNTGNVTIAGTLTQNSDARLKKEIQPLGASLKKVAQLNGYHYHWTDTAKDNQLQTGFIAQEIETVMPELVTTAEDGTKSVNYSGITPYLVEAIKELKQQNDELKKEIQELKRKK